MIRLLTVGDEREFMIKLCFVFCFVFSFNIYNGYIVCTEIYLSFLSYKMLIILFLTHLKVYLKFNELADCQ